MLATLAVLLTGCGIQPTSVPVDAGEAPSRLGCVLPDGGDTVAGPRESVVRIYLVCGSRVSPVQRALALPDGRTAVATALLESLSSRPDATERATGFGTRVPEDLEVTGDTPADPPGTLRLSEPLDGLPPFALAQVVCTFAEAEAVADDGVVLLGGPADASPVTPPRRMPCTGTLRDRAGASVRPGV